MPPEKLVLIVEDSEINYKILSKLLSPSYTLFHAENGQEALEILHRYGTSISCILLDLVMPVMDGFQFLKAIRGLEEYKNIPIIVETETSTQDSEAEALRQGAWDYITKPYNGEIIQFRLRNAIERSQLSALNQLKYLAEFDTLTGIYNKTKFFQAARELLDSNSKEQFAFVRLDIDRFGIINTFFGLEKGDALLRFLADALRKTSFHRHGVYGRMEADVFALCFSYQSKDAVLQQLQRLNDLIKSYNRSFDIVPVFGVYFLDDLTLPISEILERTTLAAKTCKGNYLDTTAIYQPELSLRLEKEQQIINEMSNALEQKQFCIYLQPKYSLKTGNPAGAEALVRWLHPIKGMISPGLFIPLFEKNGFISKLDSYIWESTCILLQRWLREGRDPSPISVNVSQVNLYNPQIVELILQLVQKYNVPPRLLQLELTESAYMDNP